MAIDFLPSPSYVPLCSPLCPQNDKNSLPPQVVGIPTLRPPTPHVNKPSPQPWWHRPQNYLDIHPHPLKNTFNKHAIPEDMAHRFLYCTTEDKCSPPAYSSLVNCHRDIVISNFPCCNFYFACNL
ncbi:hypothetical protein ES319_A06G143700v1 [Gossypium barbadense]|uniref:Uncharacterized protein n=2 Tax=Gossypium TaxID=3633 RepID=A0A5J5VER7_GOSBA|nr:hypothetical protein ES319_A06G143700v1 [Gossypium barbadense]TYH13724.1 hypothetical protein ES288_A06G161900v1 [Gossypium darwinii]